MNTLWGILILLITISGLITHVSTSSNEMRGHFLPGKFRKLGTLTGRTKSDIVAYVGEPTHINYHMPEGKILYQWIVPHYHIALLFNGEICEGITHESTSK